MKKRALVIGAFAGAAALLLSLASCQTTYDRRDPTGEVFPTVVGESLKGERVELPTAFTGRPVILLVGYKQETQFDLDRWLFGLTDAAVTADVREVPTIPGFAPGLFSGFIDSGMRRGIPSEDWGSVVTLYRDADPVARFTGTANGLPGRVLLLDREGRVTFFHDQGYSTSALLRLREALKSADAASPK